MAYPCAITCSPFHTTPPLLPPAPLTSLCLVLLHPPPVVSSPPISRCPLSTRTPSPLCDVSAKGATAAPPPPPSPLIIPRLPATAATAATATGGRRPSPVEVFLCGHGFHRECLQRRHQCPAGASTTRLLPSHLSSAPPPTAPNATVSTTHVAPSAAHAASCAAISVGGASGLVASLLEALEERDGGRGGIGGGVGSAWWDVCCCVLFIVILDKCKGDL
ncbi:unnamed protein product [Closterium sp. NIES-54]